MIFIEDNNFSLLHSIEPFLEVICGHRFDCKEMLSDNQNTAIRMGLLNKTALDLLPDCQKGEAKEKSKSTSKLRQEGGERVE